MCGIAGLLAVGTAAPPSKPELAAMIAALQHRGPDGATTFIDGPVGLAHARLSIIDLEGGWQPIANEDHSISVVLNGEIFNFVELRDRLRERGHHFRTASDTEVIVHLYEDHGDDFVEHLNGQFAVALWDSRRRRLVLARDPTGIRPLFHTRVGGRLAFASEVKALFTLPGVKRQVDVLSLASIFSYWSALPPGTPFEGISSLPPGHRMAVDEHGTTIERYWDWPFPDQGAEAKGSEQDLAEELRALLIDSVRLQLRADVPVGAYLSGGLDSSIITALIRKHTSTPLRSFSLTFDDGEFDESTWQQQLVDHLGTEHSSIRCRRADIAAAFPRTIWHTESPVVRTAPTPLMLLAGHVHAAGYKVVLTGEGADEVFGGYDLFKEAKVRRFLAREPDSKLRPRILERLYPYLQASPVSSLGFAQRFFGRDSDQPDRPGFAHGPRVATTQRIWRYLHHDIQDRLASWKAPTALQAILPAGMERWSPMSRDQYVEAQTLMSGYLLSSQGDRVAMAHSVEGRFPFLDPRVIEFGCRLPPKYKLHGLVEKYLLKRVAAGLVPDAIRKRAKQPYRAPDSSSFFEDGRPLGYVAELLSERRLAETGLFDPPAVARLVEKCGAGRAIGFADNMAFVGVLSTALLHEQFIRPVTPALRP